MVKKRPYRIVYAPEVKYNLRIIGPQYYSLIKKTIGEQLRFEPNIETRNRKPLKRPIGFEAKWELRFGLNNCFRIFYRVESINHEVWILAIGIKDGERLIFGEKEENR